MHVMIMAGGYAVGMKLLMMACTDGFFIRDFTIAEADLTVRKVFVMVVGARLDQSHK